jgi:hypothetical protein
LYNLVLGQCSDALQDKLKSHRAFDSSNQDGVALLSLIKQLTHTFEEQVFLPDATASVIRDFYGMQQRKSESLQAYHDRYLAHVQVLEEVGVSIVPSTVVDFVAGKNGRIGFETSADVAEANELYLATCFLQSVGPKFTSYLRHLRDGFLDGQNLYPSTLQQAYNILQRRSTSTPQLQPQLPGSDRVAFAQQGTDLRRITCFRCGAKGHYANECTGRNEKQQPGVVSNDCKHDVNPYSYSTHVSCYNCGERGHYSNQCHGQQLTGSSSFMTHQVSFTFSQNVTGIPDD